MVFEKPNFSEYEVFEKATPEKPWFLKNGPFRRRGFRKSDP